MTTRHAACFLVLLSLSACGDLTDVPAWVENTIYRPDGTLAVFTQAGIKVYEGDLATETASIRFTGPDYWGAYDASRDGDVASVVYDSGYDLSTSPPKRTANNELRLYEIPTGAPLGTVALTHFEQAATLSPGADLAFAFGSGSETGSEPPISNDSLYRISDGSNLWTVDEVALYKAIVGHANYCNGGSWDRPPPVFTPDGKTIFLSLFEYVMAIDVTTGTPRVFANARACIGWVDLLPDGSLLVLRGMAPLPEGSTNSAPADEAQESSVAIFASDGTLLREIPRFFDYSTAASIYASATQVACTPAGDRCAMAVESPRFRFDSTTGVVIQPTSGSLLIWNIDGTLLQSIPMDGVSSRMSFSPDGSRLAVAMRLPRGGSVARVYWVSDGTVLAERSYTNGVF